MSQRMEPATPDFAGISEPLDDFDPRIAQGAHFRNIAVPELTSQGDTIDITGTLHYDNIASPISKKDCRVLVDSPALNQKEQSSQFSLAHCQTSSFNVSVPATAAEGETIAITVEAQNNTVAGWQTTETRGPFRVKVVSEGEKVVGKTADFLPYAGVGGVVGYAASPDDPLRSAALGAGAGVAGKAVLDQAEFSFNFPTIPILATAGLLGAGAFVLSEATAVVEE